MIDLRINIGAAGAGTGGGGGEYSVAWGDKYSDIEAAYKAGKHVVLDLGDGIIRPLQSIESILKTAVFIGLRSGSVSRGEIYYSLVSVTCRDGEDNWTIFVTREISRLCTINGAVPDEIGNINVAVMTPEQQAELAKALQMQGKVDELDQKIGNIDSVLTEIVG